MKACVSDVAKAVDIPTLQGVAAGTASTDDQLPDAMIGDLPRARKAASSSRHR
jgi:hypothetical protein